ncbi:MAG: hypothetical protein ACXV6L_00590 [Halobacteriota archaeon]
MTDRAVAGFLLTVFFLRINSKSVLKRRTVLDSMDMKDFESLRNECKAVGRTLNFEVQSAVDIGAGEIDVVWTKKDHPNLPTFKLGFFFCPAEDEVSLDYITQSAAKAILSVCDKVVFVVLNEAALKSIKGKIAALDSIGGILQLKKYAHAVKSEELLGGMR